MGRLGWDTDGAAAKKAEAMLKFALPYGKRGWVVGGLGVKGPAMLVADLHTNHQDFQEGYTQVDTTGDVIVVGGSTMRRDDQGVHE